MPIIMKLFAEDHYMVRIVMAKSTWPEGEPDFSVTAVRDGETDAKAIERAEMLYCPGMDFYIVELPMKELVP